MATEFPGPSSQWFVTVPTYVSPSYSNVVSAIRYAELDLRDQGLASGLLPSRTNRRRRRRRSARSHRRARSRCRRCCESAPTRVDALRDDRRVAGMHVRLAVMAVATPIAKRSSAVPLEGPESDQAALSIRRERCTWISPSREPSLEPLPPRALAHRRRHRPCRR